MALEQKIFRTESSQSGTVHLEPFQGGVSSVQFATGSGTLVIGTLVAWTAATGLWHVWDGDGTAEDAKIDGVVYSDVDLSGSGEIIGAVMTAGEADYTSLLKVNVTDGSYGTANELKADLRVMILRDKNIRVKGLDLMPE